MSPPFSQGRDKGQWLQVALGENTVEYKRILFYCENNHRNNLPEDAVGSPTLETSKAQLDNRLTLSRPCFYLEMLDQQIFGVPSNLGFLFCDSMTYLT